MPSRGAHYHACETRRHQENGRREENESGPRGAAILWQTQRQGVTKTVLTWLLSRPSVGTSTSGSLRMPLGTGHIPLGLGHTCNGGGWA